MDNIIEKLASLEHKQWSGWMKHLFSKCNSFEIQTKYTFKNTTDEDDVTEEYNKISNIIPVWYSQKYKHHMNIAYNNMEEADKDSYRYDAKRILNTEIDDGVTIGNAIEYYLKNKGVND